MTTVFLNPDGTLELGLILLVRAETGVTYEHQCGGNSNEMRRFEGFAVPVGSPEDATPFMRWFAARSRSQRRGAELLDADFDELDELLSGIRSWGIEGASPVPLSLDRALRHEAVEAWIPVRSAMGASVLVFNNSD